MDFDKMLNKWFSTLNKIDSPLLDFFTYDDTELACKRIYTHIEKVKKYGKKFGVDIKGHDNTKFSEENIIGYILLEKRNRNLNINFPKEVMEEIYKVTENHVFKENHHPEAWSVAEDKGSIRKSIIDSRTNGGKFNKENIIEIPYMPTTYIIEMCADWCAMSEEFNNSPFVWANKTLDIRWKFDDKTTNFIYDVLEEMWY